MVSPSRDPLPKIDTSDLEKLARIAEQDLTDFFRQKKAYRPLGGRVLLVALCQGAALHYAEGVGRINDFDVWTFFEENPTLPRFPRRRKPRDFGDPKFGTSADRPDYMGLRVDLMGRSIPRNGDGARSIQQYLLARKTKTARELSKKAVVSLSLGLRFGEVIWLRGSPVLD